MKEFELQYGRLLNHKFADVKKKQQSFLQIAGLAHYENVNSNQLRFYLDAREEHGFGDLFLKSLLELLKPHKELSFTYWTVKREVSTSLRKRIDLVVLSEDDDAAIIIENKFYHYLNNDLEDYWNRYPKIADTNKVGVVLSLGSTTTTSSRYINITHKQLCDQVLKNLGSYILVANQKHLIYLMDYIENINSFYMSETDKNKFRFYFEYAEKINELALIKQHVEKYIFDQVIALSEPLGIKAQFIGSNCSFLFRFPEVENGSLYYGIFLKGIFSGESTFQVILEGDNINEKIQRTVINAIANDYSGLQHAEEPNRWVHFLKKTYEYYPSETENFTSTLLAIIENEFEAARGEITKVISNSMTIHQLPED